MFSPGHAESNFHIFANMACVHQAWRNKLKLRRLRLVCPPLFPCFYTPVVAEAEGKEMADRILGSILGCWPAYPSAKWCVRRLNHLLKKVLNPCFSSKQAGNCLLAHCETQPRNCAECQKQWKMTLRVLTGAGPLKRWGTGTRQLSNYFNMHKKSGYAWSWLRDLWVELLFSPDFLLHLYCLFKMGLCLDWSFVIVALQASTSIASENITLKPAQLYKSQSHRQNTKHRWRLPGFPVKHRQSWSQICSNHHIPPYPSYNMLWKCPSGFCFNLITSVHTRCTPPPKCIYLHFPTKTYLPLL